LDVVALPEMSQPSLVGSRRKAVLLDRDGTLIKDVPYLHEPDRVVLMPAATTALRHFHAAGFALVLVTNQSGVGRGRFPLAAMHAVHDRLQSLLGAEGCALDAIYYCPHAPDAACGCRKPEIGMAERAQRELGLDLSASIMIGDKAIDMAFGRRIGATTVLLAAPASEATADADHVVADLGEAVARLGVTVEARG
jgi:histidinol-phosphate phosphatase family protein